MLIIKYCLFLNFLFNADPILRPSFNEILPKGDIPVSDFNLESHFIVAHPPGDSIWVFQTNAVWIYDLTLNEWTKYGNLEFEDKEIVGSYSASQESFVFWSSGVGKVYTWKPGDKEVQRVDNSFHHRTQFNHLPFLDSKDGSIYAFGGTGFWESRSFITRFDPRAKEWQIMPINDVNAIPMGRMDAIGIFDEKRRQIHAYGGYGHEYERQDVSSRAKHFDDYWVYDLKSNNWIEQTLIGSKRTQNPSISKQVSYVRGFASLDMVNDLGWYIVLLHESDYRYQLMVYDLNQSLGVYLPVYFKEIGSLNTVRYMGFDNDGNRLIIIGTSRYPDNTSISSIKIYSYELPDPIQTRAYIEQYRQQDTSIASKISTHLWFLLPFTLTLGVVGFFVYRRKNKSNEGLANTSNEQLGIMYDKINGIFLSFEEIPKVRVRGIDVSATFSSLELHLFLWLFWKNKSGHPYQSTDEIDAVFWNDIPNADYVRKLRTMSLKRLNEQMKHAFNECIVRENWISSRNNYDDRRKREYALDLSDVIIDSNVDKVNIDLNQFFFKIHRNVKQEAN